MSETDEELDQEMQDIIEKELATAAKPEPKPVEPEPEPETVTQESAEQPKEADTTEEAPEPQPTDDSIEWARKKGLKTPEDIARSYRELEKKWHKENQSKGNGYQNGYPNGFQNGNPAPQPQVPSGWQPNPGYQPQPRPQGDVVKEFARRHQMDEGDAERLLPAIVEVARLVNQNNLTPLQQEILEIRRQSQKTSRLTQLMQDPLFADPTIAKEMHHVFEANPSLFSRDDGYEIAFAQAKDALLRQQIQRSQQKMPPTTAGGGNARSGPKPNPMKAFASMSDAEQEAYLLKLNKQVPNM